MNFSAQREMGFEKLLLVEGATEVRVFQQFLRKLGKDHKIVLLPLHGRITGKMSDELEEVLRITPNVAAIIDSERTSDDDALATNRQEFVSLCEGLSIKCHVLLRRATENYFDDASVAAVFGPGHRALAPFEKINTAEWSKANNWKLADAMQWSALRETDLGQFLEGL